MTKKRRKRKSKKSLCTDCLAKETCIVKADFEKHSKDKEIKIIMEKCKFKGDISKLDKILPEKPLKYHVFSTNDRILIKYEVKPNEKN